MGQEAQFSPREEANNRFAQFPDRESQITTSIHHCAVWSSFVHPFWVGRAIPRSSRCTSHLAIYHRFLYGRDEQHFNLIASRFVPREPRYSFCVSEFGEVLVCRSHDGSAELYAFGYGLGLVFHILRAVVTI